MRGNTTGIYNLQGKRMTKITKDEVLKLAKMSNILMYDNEAEILAKDLEEVLTYASSLQTVAERYQGYAPLPQNVNIMRDDVIQATPVEPILQLAPEHEGSYIVVPKIIKN